jgi:hypothetical protein
MMSESIKELAGALSKAQGAFDHAKKDVKNDFFKSRYADLAGCIDAAKAHLAANGLAVSQITDIANGEIILTTVLMHSSGEYISGSYPVKPIKQDPQAFGSALTYARRYAFCAITGIASDDDDGNSASQKPESKKPEANKLEYRTDAEFQKMVSDRVNPETGEIIKISLKSRVQSGEVTVEDAIKTIKTRILLTAQQLETIKSWEPAHA